LQRYGASPAIRKRICHPTQLNARPVWTPARQTGTRFPYPGGMKSWVDFVVGYVLRWLICLQTVTHPGKHDLIATRPEVELTTWQQVQRHSRYIPKPFHLHTIVAWQTGWLLGKNATIMVQNLVTNLALQLYTVLLLLPVCNKAFWIRKSSNAVVHQVNF